MKTFSDFILEEKGDTPFHKYSKNTLEELEVLLKHHQEDLEEYKESKGTEGDEYQELLKDIEEVKKAIQEKK